MSAPRGVDDGRRRCDWCREQLSTTARPGTRFDSRKCRQSAFRLRRRRATELEIATPESFGYADPPYPGRAARFYKGEASFAGEVDHVALIASLAAAGYAGWALSTAADALEDLLPIVKAAEPNRRRRVCSWVKPIAPSPRTFGLHNTWEPLIVVGGRELRPGKRDWLRAQPARFGGTLPGRKPIAFAAWLFDCLGMLPGDTLADLFPGTGVVSRAWASLAHRGGVAEDLRDTSPGSARVVRDVVSDASPGAIASASLERRATSSAPGRALELFPGGVA